ncbi:MAG: VanZ family protein [Planctomycetota bacterium]|nr:VanZ family protein [Planctomycetota bacterium]
MLTLYQQRLRPWMRISIVVLWAALIWVLSSQDGDSAPSGAFSRIVWNGGHVVVFGVLAGLIMLSFQGNMAVRFRLAVATAVFYGAVDELHQSFVPGRSMDLWDLCSDGLGAGLFSCTAWWLLTDEPRPRAWILPLAILALCSACMAE